MSHETQYTFRTGHDHHSIVTALLQLKEETELALANGWILHGTPIAGQKQSGEFYAIQALTKEVPNNG